MLEPRYQAQIEDAIGRRLVPAELVEVSELKDLTMESLRLAKRLRSLQFVLCTVYVHALVPVRGREMAHFIDRLNDEG